MFRHVSVQKKKQAAYYALILVSIVNGTYLVYLCRAGLNFDVAVEGLSVTGNLQLICHMSMDVPFPHVSKVTVSFTEK